MPLTVVCNGIVRSGSTWSYNVCRALVALRAERSRQPFVNFYQTAERFDDMLRERLAWASGLAVVKAHQLGSLAQTRIRMGDVKAVCTIRDPRDCVASDMVFMNHDVHTSAGRVSADISTLNPASDFGRTLYVRYEDMIRDTRSQIHLIAGYLGVSLDDTALTRIDGQTNLASSRRLCDSLKTRSSGQVTVIGGHRVDPLTQLHDNHIGSARVGRWRDDLPHEVGKQLTAHFGPALVAFGYETEGSLTSLLSTRGPSVAMPARPIRGGDLNLPAAQNA